MKLWSIAKIVQAALKNKKIRSVIIVLLVTPIVLVYILTSMVFYIVTSPLDLLLNGKEDVIGLEQFKENFSFNGYYDYNDIEYEEVYVGNGETNVVYFNQNDMPWRNMLYGTLKNIGASGCGPTSMAMVISTLASTSVSPAEAASWAYKNGYLVEGYHNMIPYAMSSHSLIPDMAGSYGLSSIGISKNRNTASKIYSELAKGKLIVAIMGPGHFTSGGHFIVLRGVKDGKILVADSASRERTSKSWDINIIINEARSNAGAGGPFWAIGKE